MIYMQISVKPHYWMSHVNWAMVSIWDVPHDRNVHCIYVHTLPSVPFSSHYLYSYHHA
jgi:hypothetical protein